MITTVRDMFMFARKQLRRMNPFWLIQMFALYSMSRKNPKFTTIFRRLRCESAVWTELFIALSWLWIAMAILSSTAGMEERDRRCFSLYTLWLCYVCLNQLHILMSKAFLEQRPSIDGVGIDRCGRYLGHYLRFPDIQNRDSTLWHSIFISCHCKGVLCGLLGSPYWHNSARSDLVIIISAYYCFKAISCNHYCI